MHLLIYIAERSSIASNLRENQESCSILGCEREGNMIRDSALRTWGNSNPVLDPSSASARVMRRMKPSRATLLITQMHCGRNFNHACAGATLNHIKTPTYCFTSISHPLLCDYCCSLAISAGRRLLLKWRKNCIQIPLSQAKTFSRHPRPPHWLLLEHGQTHVRISDVISHLLSPHLHAYDHSNQTATDVETWVKGCLWRAMHASASVPVPSSPNSKWPRTRTPCPVNLLLQVLSLQLLVNLDISRLDRGSSTSHSFE